MTPEEKARADARVHAWNLANPDRRRKIARAWARKWRDENKEQAREQAYRYRDASRERSRYQTDAGFRAVKLLRAKLYASIKRLPTKTRLLTRWDARSTIGPLVGCSPADLKSHIESQFLPGMSWKNYGRDGWEVDHIKPCATFDLTDPDQCRVCFHFSNLRPLWFTDNQAARRISD